MGSLVKIAGVLEGRLWGSKRGVRALAVHNHNIELKFH